MSCIPCLKSPAVAMVLARCGSGSLSLHGSGHQVPQTEVDVITTYQFHFEVIRLCDIALAFLQDRSHCCSHYKTDSSTACSMSDPSTSASCRERGAVHRPAKQVPVRCTTLRLRPVGVYVLSLTLRSDARHVLTPPFNVEHKRSYDALAL